MKISSYSLRLSVFLLATSVGLLGSTAIHAQSLGDAWYFGFGGGGSLLEPNPSDAGIMLDDDADDPTGGSFFIGRDAGNFSSVQLQAFSLGTATLDNGETIDYRALEGSVLYRFFDTRDRSLRRGGMALALYGRIGLGVIDREIGVELPLEFDSDFYFGAGLGAEWFIWGPLSLRAEYNYLDRDAQIAQLSLAFRFGGGSSGSLPPAPVPQETRFPSPEVPSTELPSPEVPATAPPTRTDQPAVNIEAAPTGGFETPAETTPTATPGQVELIPDTPATVATQPVQRTPTGDDTDGDGVTNSLDQCADSRAGYPVREDGCPLFNGVLSGVTFEGRTATMNPASFAQLDFLANVMQQYPQARIQLLAHTDSIGNRVDQANITRMRLRVIGSYLVRKGVSAKRMVLRSLGGESPAYNNDTTSGREANNRIEVLEQQ